MSVDSVPAEVGVIVLPGAILFPGTFLPLHIFEPRYRLMVERALEGERIFAIGGRRPGGGPDDAFEMGGVGMIRACVQNPDGTANLILEGLRRVRFAEWTQIEPYRIARLEPAVSVNGDAEAAECVALVLREICAQLTAEGVVFPQAIESALTRPLSAEHLGDELAALIAAPDLQRQIFEELDVPTRLRGLMNFLREQLRARDLPDHGRP